MTKDQIIDLLSVIAVGDKRTTGEAEVQFWHGLVGDLEYAECAAAVATHFKTSTDYLMPVHIRRHVTSARQDHAMRALPHGSEDRVPMPDWFRAEVARHAANAKANRTAALDAGDPVTFGAAITTALDHRSPTTRAVRDYWNEDVR